MKTTGFLAIVPLYPAKMEFKLRKGSDALLDKLTENEINDIVYVERKNVVKKLF